MDEGLRIKIKKVEKEIKLIKELHLMKRMSTEDAKRNVRDLEKKIQDLLAILPAHEKDIYLLDKEVYGI